MNKEQILNAAIGALLALLVWHLFLGKALSKFTGGEGAHYDGSGDYEGGETL